MPPAPDQIPASLLFEPEFLPLARAYGYLRLAGVAPRPAAAAVARLQATLAMSASQDASGWRHQLLADPAWVARREVSILPSPPLGTRRQLPCDDPSA